LYDHEDKQKETADGSLEVGNPVLHTGLLVRPLPSLQEAVLSLIERLYAGIVRPDGPITGKSQPKTERNNEVKRLYSIGWKVPAIATYFGVSIPRVYQILRGD